MYDHYRHWLNEQAERLQAEAAPRSKNRFFVALAILCWIAAALEVLHAL